MKSDEVHEAEARCYFCPRHCRIFLTIGHDEIVRHIRRELLQSRCGPGAGEARCGRLRALLGLHVEKAKAILRAPNVPRIVVGGH